MSSPTDGAGAGDPVHPEADDHLDMAEFERQFRASGRPSRTSGRPSGTSGRPSRTSGRNDDFGELPPIADTPLWLSHHWPSEYDRCARVSGRHVCRRCMVLYPLAAVCAVLVGAGLTWASRLDVWFCWLLPLPSVVEFVGEHLGLLRYRVRRSVLLTIPLAVGCAKLYVRYLDDTRDQLAWSVVIAYGGLCLLATLARSFRPPADRR